jgi:hypothetical protein
MCRRLADEVRALEPILRDIQSRVDTFPDHTKDMIDRALDLLVKGMFFSFSHFIQIFFSVYHVTEITTPLATLL